MTGPVDQPTARDASSPVRHETKNKISMINRYETPIKRLIIWAILHKSHNSNSKPYKKFDHISLI